MERLADAGLPCRFSVLIEGGGLAGLDSAMTNVASAFLAFSSDDSLLVRNAMRDLSALGADAHAIVRLRLGLLTWVAPEDGEDALRRRLSRLQQLAEGWGETVFTPLVGDPLESLAASVPGFCCGATAEPALAPLTEAAAPAAGGQTRALVEQRYRTSVPLNRRQAHAVRLGGRRGLRFRADLRRPRARPSRC